MEVDNDDGIASALGITPIKEVRNSQIMNYDRPEVDNNLSAKEQLDVDREYVRTNLYLAIEHGVKALEEITEIARQTTQPRAFEVVATLIKSLSDINKDLIGLSSDKVKDTKTEEPTESKTINNTIVFNGSTKDLLAAITKNNQ